MTQKPWNGWELQGECRRGGMGIVFRALDPAGKIGAIKMGWKIDPSFRAAIRREIRILSNLETKGVVKILDWGFEDGIPWYAMEWLEGDTLREWMQPEHVLGTSADLTEGSISGFEIQTEYKTTLPLRAFIDGPDLKNFILKLIPIFGVLSSLHAAGIVHGDIKPEHFIFTPNGIRLVDFGLASTAVGIGGRTRVELRAPKSGTMPYMSPEQKRGETIDARTDLYAMGCIICEFLTGQTYEPSADQYSIFPDPLSYLLKKLMNENRAQRLAYADEAAQLLCDFVGEIHDGFPRNYMQGTAFIGRKKIFAEVLDMLKRSQSVCLHGAFGIGKSRMLDEIARTWILQKKPVLISHISGTLRQQLDLLDSSFGNLEDSKTPSVDGFSFTQRVLNSLPMGGLSLCVIDDADQLHSDVKRAISTLAGQQKQIVFLIACHREGLEYPNLENIEVKALTADGTRELARQAVATSDLLGGEALHNLVERTVGNPLLIFDALRQKMEGTPAISEVGIRGFLRAKIRACDKNELLMAHTISIADGAEVGLLNNLGISISTRDNLCASGLVRMNQERYSFIHPITSNLLKDFDDNTGSLSRQIADLLRGEKVGNFDALRIEKIVSEVTETEDRIEELIRIATSARENEEREVEYIARVRLQGIQDFEPTSEQLFQFSRSCLENHKARDAHSALEKAKVHASFGQERPFKYYILGGLIAEQIGSIEILKELVFDIRRDATHSQQGAYADFYEGMIAFREQDEKAGSCFRTSAQKWKNIDMKNYARSIQLNGIWYAREGKLEQGMLFLENAASVQRQEKDWGELRRTLNMMSVNYAIRGYYRQAISMVNEAAVVPLLNVSAVDRGMSRTKHAVFLWHLDERKRARIVQQEALDLLIYNGASLNLFIAYLGMAKMELSDGKIHIGKEWLWRAQKLKEKIGLKDATFTATLANAWGKLALLLGNKSQLLHQTKIASENVLSANNSSNSVIVLVHSALMIRCSGNPILAEKKMSLAEPFLENIINDRIHAIWLAEHALVLDAQDKRQASVKHANEALRLVADRETLKVDFSEADYLPLLQEIAGK